MSPSYNRNGHANGSGGLDLTGAGAAYVRVSDDEQDTERQHAAVRAFFKRHGASVADGRWFADEGWARDKAAVRPAFNRLLGLAEAGKVRWIVVAERDRFGTTDADEFVHYRYLLRQWGCRLYDAAGTDWTRKDIATVITAVVEGDKSEQEQHSISKRTLGGKAARARKGEWQGGAVPLGLDVVCYARGPGGTANAQLSEQWRLVDRGKNRGVKVYPDGREEPYEGKPPRCQPDTQVLRLDPSKDQSRVRAAVAAFEAYAAEAVSPTELADRLNRLGFGNGHGGAFQGHHVERMLGNPVYLGYYAWNRGHCGKFHRLKDGETVPELNYGRKGTRNDESDWVQSHRLFEPLVGQKTWAAVQKKLARPKRAAAPRSPGYYLRGLPVCAGCGAT